MVVHTSNCPYHEYYNLTELQMQSVVKLPFEMFFMETRYCVSLHKDRKTEAILAGSTTSEKHSKDN